MRPEHGIWGGWRVSDRATERVGPSRSRAWERQERCGPRERRSRHSRRTRPPSRGDVFFYQPSGHHIPLSSCSNARSEAGDQSAAVVLLDDRQEGVVLNCGWHRPGAHASASYPANPSDPVSENGHGLTGSFPTMNDMSNTRRRNPMPPHPCYERATADSSARPCHAASAIRAEHPPTPHARATSCSMSTCRQVRWS